VCILFVSVLSSSYVEAGTGKTTVVVQILRRILQNISDESKVLMTASTHNGASAVHVHVLEFPCE
jgi:hypothetical protein